MESNYFLNLRDIALYSRQKIKKNIIYRSSDLSAYVNDPVLSQWFHEKGIKSIIDLRNRKEILKRRYPKELLKLINYKNMKLVSDETDERIQGRNSVEFYKWVLENEGDRIRELFEFFIDKDNYPLVIHCLVGMDRTGIIIALIHMLIRTPWKQIKEDFMASGSNMKKELIEFIYNSINDSGGINLFLESIGLSRENQKKIIEYISL